jgi:hypothetical protein
MTDILLKEHFTMADWAEVLLIDEKGDVRDQTAIEALHVQTITDRTPYSVADKDTREKAYNILMDPAFDFTKSKDDVLQAFKEAVDKDPALKTFEAARVKAKEVKIADIKKEVHLYTLKDWVNILLIGTGGQLEAIKNNLAAIKDPANPYFSDIKYVQESVEKAFEILEKVAMPSLIASYTEDHKAVLERTNKAIDKDSDLKLRLKYENEYKTRQEARAAAKSSAPATPRNATDLTEIDKIKYKERSVWYKNGLRYLAWGAVMAAGTLALGGSALVAVAVLTVAGPIVGATVEGGIDWIQVWSWSYDRKNSFIKAAEKIRADSDKLPREEKDAATKLLKEADSLIAGAKQDYNKFNIKDNSIGRILGFWRETFVDTTDAIQIKMGMTPTNLFKLSEFSIKDEAQKKSDDEIVAQLRSGKERREINTLEINRAALEAHQATYLSSKAYERMERDKHINPHIYTGR